MAGAGTATRWGRNLGRVADPTDPTDADTGEQEAAPFGADTTDDAVPTRPVDKFRRTAVGSVVAAGLFGLRDALEGRPEREQTAVVSEARTPAEKGPIEVVLDFERPGHGIVVIRRQPDDDLDG
jgi:hypothetical protein